MDVQNLKRPSQRPIHPHRITKKHLAIVTMFFICFVLFVLVYLMSWISGDKISTKNHPTIRYPKWKNEASLLKTCGIPVQSIPFIKVTDLSTYLVSSYIEHREHVKKVRTIAVMLRSENAKYYCLLCCNGQFVSTAATYEIHKDHFGYIYGTADIMCRIPETCIMPSYLTITSKPLQEDGMLEKIHALIPIRNQQAQKEFPYKFTVCISTMYDYVNVLMLVQAMEMFKILGAQKVAIYKTSCHPVTQKVLDYYVKQEFVEIIPWRISSYINVSRGWKISVSPGDLHYFGQIAALNDCLYRYMYQSRYIAMIDLDEFILPLKLHNWLELLSVLEKKYSRRVGFEFKSVFFPTSLTDLNPNYSPSSWKNVMGDNILEHVYSLVNYPKVNPIKVIVNPRLVFRTTVHGLLQSVSGSIRVNPKIAHIYHMRNVSKEIMRNYTKKQDTRHRYYADLLIPAVSKVLQQVGIDRTDG